MSVVTPLLSFFSSFESGIDKQRLRTIEDDRNSRKTPRMETPLHIEKYAAQVYTLALYYRVREEIRNACFHTTMPEMSRTDEMRYFTCKDDLAKCQLFKVPILLTKVHTLRFAQYATLILLFVRYLCAKATMTSTVVVNITTGMAICVVMPLLHYNVPH